ncbi:MAG: DUF3291 domain-containing protein [Eudoraea sp.]|nr:DUF3291 domain-containing protein [Eudoraea sp.]
MSYHFAQVNIARAKFRLDDPRMADFVNNTARINALAEVSPGFIWRWIEEPSDEVCDVYGDPALVVNMSLWESRETLMAFTYKTAHADIYKRRKEWFSKLKDNHMVCWYTKEPTISLMEAKKRLDHLNTKGESAYAFSFRSNFTIEEARQYL